MCRTNTLADERAFFTDFYERLLQDDGVTADIRTKAEYLGEKLWYVYKRPFTEVVEVLDYFKERNYRMGVISDGPPSLQYSLELIGLHRYFTVFVASSQVGVGKPDPRIYRQAMASVGVDAADCLYVDDTEAEADGARNLGMTAFHLRRNKTGPNTAWTIASLKELIGLCRKAPERTMIIAHRMPVEMLFAAKKETFSTRKRDMLSGLSAKP